MKAICPICKNPESKALDKLGNADGFDCPKHDKFRVSSTAKKLKVDATPEQWEAALKKARARTKPDEWPVIRDDDF